MKFTISVNNGKLKIVLFQCVIYETVDRYGILCNILKILPNNLKKERKKINC